METQKIGMRTIKTAVAVTICSIAEGLIVQNTLYAVLACLISVQDTVKGSFKSGINRIKGTILGGIIGYIFLIISPCNDILSGLGTVLIITICNSYKINSGIVVAMVTFISIHHGIILESPEEYALLRIWDTTVGVIVGVGINYLVGRPDYVEKSIEHINSIEEVIEEYIKVKIINKEEFNLNKMSSQISKLENVYKKLSDELDYTDDYINIENIECQLILAKETYYHMQSIQSLEKELYLNQKNYNLLTKIYNLKKIDYKIDEYESPVFNYHLRKIIREVQHMQKII